MSSWTGDIPVPGPCGRSHSTWPDPTSTRTRWAVSRAELPGGPAPSVRPGQAQHVLSEIAEDHLLRNRRDAHQPGLPPVALDVVLARVAEAAVHLHGDVGSLEAGLGRQELGQIRLLTAGQARVDAPRCLPDRQLGGGQPGVRLGQRERDALILADRAAEDDPFPGVGDGAAQGGAARAERFGGDEDSLRVKAVEQVVEAAAL